MRVACICTVLNPDETMLKRLLDSTKDFDETLIHIDPDNMKEIILPPYVRRIESPMHLNITEAFNFCASQTSCDWISISGYDDYYHKDNLKIALDYARSDPKVDIINFGVMSISQYDSEQFEERPWPKYPKITLDKLKEINMVSSAAFIRKELYESLGGMKGELFQDWILWMRCLLRNKEFTYIDKIVAYNMFRKNGGAAKQFARINWDKDLERKIVWEEANKYEKESKNGRA